VEAWAADAEAEAEGRQPELVGGLYGVAIGGLFAGESMFHVRTDASKVALIALVEALGAADPAGRLLDVQWVTPHLDSLGAVQVPRRDYLELLDKALGLPVPPVFCAP
jgi:leucyl/phenylalanyl-tRNA--protein transferase